MSRSLEPTLLSLLPSLPQSSLPQTLVELASSLVAQSRHSASTLRAEEEVARLYACAHIACERLKITLDLPPIQARPPVPPRIYKRLYDHLDHILPASSVSKGGRVRTPSSKVRGRDGTEALGSVRGDRPTPSKEATLAQFRTKSDGTPSKSKGTPSSSKRGQPASTRDVGLPTWVRPVITSICKTLENETIGRTVLAGMQSIIAPHGRRTKDAWVLSHFTSLLAAIYFLVSTKVTALETGQKIDGRAYARIRREILAAIEIAKEKVKDEDWEGWNDIGSKDVDAALDRVAGSEWKDGEWFTGIEDMVANAKRAKVGGNDVDMDVDDDEDDVAVDGGKVQVQKGDTMFQARWIVTDAKREEYQRWKESILKRCDEIDEEKANRMDVDVEA